MSGIVPTPPVVGTSTPIPTPPANPAAPSSPIQPAEQPAEDWQVKFEAQQKVNRDLEAKLKAAIPKDEAESLRAELAKLQGKEQEYAAEQERVKAQREAEAAALAKANDRILKAEIRALAASRLRDPEDALRYLDLSGFQVGDDGEVDRTAVAAAVDELVKSKPYLAAEGGEPGTVFESPTSRREGGTPPQLTTEDVKKLYAEKKYDEIEAARKDGRLAKVLGATT